MTYNSFHKSAEGSQPVTLYTFYIGTKIYRHTSAEQDFNHGGNVYENYIGISHSKVVNSGDAAKSTVSVSLDYLHPLSAWIRAYIPSQEWSVEIKSLERGDNLTETAELVHEFKGDYIKYEAKFPVVKLFFAPADYELNREALQPSFGLNCQHTQYDNGCGLQAANFELANTIDVVSGYDVTVTGVLNGVSADHYSGGYLEVLGEYGLELAWITSVTSNLIIVVDRVTPAMLAGASIKMYPSCRASYDRCKDPALFNNRVKYLGAPYADKVNPFDGSGAIGEV